MSSLASLKKALTSWRTASATLLSFSSGLPLGLVWISIPDWMRDEGTDIRLVGLLSLAQLPWTLKLLWAPLLEAYSPGSLGRGRSWLWLTQWALLLLVLGLGYASAQGLSFWLIFAFVMLLAFFAATQDIALDGYVVELLNKDEQSVAVGARTAMYRCAMYLAGSLSITLAATVSWSWVFVGLALSFIPMLMVTRCAPKLHIRARDTHVGLSDVVWRPLLEMLSRPRALEILAFVILYKLCDNLAGALLRPFLVDLGYSAFDRGVALGTVGLVATLLGTFVGGVFTGILGVSRSLWIFGVLQIFSNVGYVILADLPPIRSALYVAMGLESLTQGLATGAFSVLLLRLTKRRFSMTQYAVLSSLFSISRVFSGPVAGILVDGLGWAMFFMLTIASGVPGLVMLRRFAPWGGDDTLIDDSTQHGELPLNITLVSHRVWRYLFAALPLSIILLGAMMATLRALKSGLSGSQWGIQMKAFFLPSTGVAVAETLSVLIAALLLALLASAYLAVQPKKL